MKFANQRVDWLIAAAVLACCLNSIALAEYPEGEGTECWPKSGILRCEKLGWKQCKIQGGGECYDCIAATPLKDTVCVAAAGSGECFEWGGKTFNCGIMWKRTCTGSGATASCPGTGGVNDGICDKVGYGCNPD